MLLCSFLGKMFKDSEIEIVIHEVEDETEYLLKSSANKAHLLQAISKPKSKMCPRGN